jgi:hypothetical protein
VDYNNISDPCWTVRVPESVRVEIVRLARIERRKPSEMLRLVLFDALAQRASNNNNEVMKKADAT